MLYNLQIRFLQRNFYLNFLQDHPGYLSNGLSRAYLSTDLSNVLSIFSTVQPTSPFLGEELYLHVLRDRSGGH